MSAAHRLLLLLALSIGGCVSTVGPAPFDPENYALALEQRQFRQAQSMLQSPSAMRLDQQQRQQLAEQLDMAAQLYEQDLIRNAGQLQQQQQWYEAGRLYTQGLDALPQNPALGLAYEEYSAQRQQYVDAIKKDLKLHRAQLLPREIQLTRSLSEVDPRDQRLQNKLYDMQQEAASLVVFMTPLAQSAYARGEYQQAKQLDQQILLLGESEQSRQRIVFIDAKLNQDAQRRAQGRQLANKKKRDGIWQEYDQALQQGDYLLARSALDKLDALGFKGPIAEEELQRLDALISEQCAALIAEGKKFYTRGKLDAAINSWRQALVLNPDNQDLVARVKRAETFQANYQRLSQ